MIIKNCDLVERVSLRNNKLYTRMVIHWEIHVRENLTWNTSWAYSPDKQLPLEKPYMPCNDGLKKSHEEIALWLFFYIYGPTRAGVKCLNCLADSSFLKHIMQVVDVHTWHSLLPGVDAQCIFCKTPTSLSKWWLHTVQWRLACANNVVKDLFF